MYIDLKIDSDLLKQLNIGLYKDFKLCYLHSIDEYLYLSGGETVKNPEYSKDSQISAYFSQENIEDIINENNYYDDQYISLENIPKETIYGTPIDIIKINFSIKSDKINYRFVADELVSFYNFKTEDALRGAMSWLYISNESGGISINTGDTIENFINKLNKSKKI